MGDGGTRDFLVRRNDLNAVQWADAPTRADTEPGEGEALLRIDRYAFTANNITYGLMGDLMHYWDFFPGPAGWGRIPVWGFADVAASRVAGLHEGERIYGYFPMSSLLRVKPEQLTPQTFVDGTEHRRALPAIYQQYTRTRRGEPLHEDVRALLQPLFGTAFLLDDWLIESGLFAARQIVLISASSKTALGAAYLLSRRPERTFEIVGLTSAKNRAFCDKLGYYDRVHDYAELRALPAGTSTVLIDMAGNSAVLRALHEHFQGALRHSCVVGSTHRGGPVAPSAEPLPGPAQQLFFAPTWIEKRRADWGMDGLGERLKQAQNAFFPAALTWLELSHGRGEAAIEATYRRVLHGDAQPQQGLTLSP